MSLDALVRELVVAEVARRLAELQRPELVTQRTVAGVVGMPARDYLRHVRAGDWASWADRRLRYSRTADVVAWITAHPMTPRSAHDAGDEAAAFARARTCIRRVG